MKSPKDYSKSMKTSSCEQFLDLVKHEEPPLGHDYTKVLLKYINSCNKSQLYIFTSIAWLLS